MLFIFLLIAIFLGTILAFFAEEELEEGRKYLTFFTMALLSYFIFYLLTKLKLTSYNLIVLAVTILLSAFVKFSFFSAGAKRRVGSVFQEVPKGIMLVFYPGTQGVIFPLLLYSILEGSLVYKDKLGESLRFVAFSQAIFLIGYLISNMLNYGLLIPISIGLLLSVLSKDLFPVFMKEFSTELKKLRSVL